MSFAKLLLAEHRREALVADCVKLIEHQVNDRGPVGRLTLKAGLAVLNSVKPKALNRGIDRLLPDFVRALEPLYQQFQLSAGPDFSLFLQQHPEDTVAALLAVTDLHAREHQNSTVRSAYERLRPTAVAEVRAALPGLCRLLSRHLGRALQSRPDVVRAAC